MEDIKQRIIEYVEVLDDTIDDDSYLNLIIDDVINRFMIYTNRFQLLNDEADNYDEVIPQIVETSLAQVVVSVHKSVKELVNADSSKIEKMKDGQQEISYGSGLQQFMSSASDSDIFMSVSKLFDNFKMLTVVEADEDSTVF